jgi:two-component system chemotaxis response regulator CheB
VCPECGGALWEVEDNRLVRYTCHVGHAYSTESMLSAEDGMLEAALWGAIRALREKAALARRIAARMERPERAASKERLLADATRADEAAGIISALVADLRSAIPTGLED